MKIAAVTLYPPKKAGSAFYALSLYEEVARHIETVILTDEAVRSAGTIKVTKAWNRNSILLPFELFNQIYRTKPSICHFQVEYRSFSDIALVSSIDTLLAIALARISNVKITTTLHGIIYPALAGNENIQLFNKTLTRILLTLFYRSLAVFSKRLIVHSQMMKEVLHNEYKVKDRKIIVIPHGAIRARTLIRKPGNGIVKLFFHGFIRPGKGLECLLKAMQIVASSHKDIRLIVAGGAPFQELADEEFYVKKLRSMVEDLQLKTFVEIRKGVLGEDELEAYILSSDILIFPYVDRYLEVSGAVARVMDYKVPIICTRTPRFLSDLQDGKDSLLVAPNDEKELASAIINLIVDQKLGKRLSENLKEKARTRYWDVLAEQYIRLFDEEGSS